MHRPEGVMVMVHIRRTKIVARIIVYVFSFACPGPFVSGWAGLMWIKASKHESQITRRRL